MIACGAPFCGQPSAEAQVSIQRDADGGGVTDEIDLCPGTMLGDSVSWAGCILTTVDTDNDGVTDDLDYCTNAPTSNPQNTNGCELSQIDSGGDGEFNDAYPYQHLSQA